jgi:hypothetical protein
MFYEYILVNAYDESTLRYVNREAARVIRSALVDSGVHSVFHTLRLKEYPGGYQYWVARVVRMWRAVSRLVPEAFAVVPDYPSDYPGNDIEDNVERTLRNIEYATAKYPDVKWVIPLQGRRDDAPSVLKSLEYVKDAGLLERYGYVAVAPTCTTRNVGFLEEVARAVRRRLRALEARGYPVKVHMFGVTTRAWERLAPYVDSVDAIITNYLCLELIGKMCTRKVEKELAWQAFLERVSRVAAVKRVTLDGWLT